MAPALNGNGDGGRAWLSETTVVIAMTAFAVPQLAVAAWAVIDPAGFHDRLGDYGPYSRHGISDFAAMSAATGAGLLVGARRPVLRAGVLWVATVLTGLHAVVHVVDLDKGAAAVPAGLTLTALVATTATFAVLLRKLTSDDPAKTPR